MTTTKQNNTATADPSEPSDTQPMTFASTPSPLPSNIVYSFNSRSEFRDPNVDSGQVGWNMNYNKRIFETGPALVCIGADGSKTWCYTEDARTTDPHNRYLLHADRAGTLMTAAYTYRDRLTLYQMEWLFAASSKNNGTLHVTTKHPQVGKEPQQPGMVYKNGWAVHSISEDGTVLEMRRGIQTPPPGKYRVSFKLVGRQSAPLYLSPPTAVLWTGEVTAVPVIFEVREEP